MFSLVIGLLSAALPWALSLDPQETAQVLSVARQDPANSRKYYLHAIEEGAGAARVEAMYELAQLHSQSPESDFLLLTRAADLGHVRAQHELAAAYFTGVSRGIVPVDAGRALMLSHFAALAGYSPAHMSLGYRYHLGEGVPESCERALLHYEYAANEAAFQIEKRGYALPLERNRLSDDTAAAVRSAGAAGGEMDLETLDYFAQLAQDGDMSSAISLASIYSSGYKNVKVDMQMAVKYLSLAADAGWINAQGQLGWLLATGPEGVQVDPDRAFHLLAKADRRQDTLGTLGLGFCFFKGIGTAVNLTRAIELLQRVSGKHIEASYLMGEILMGVGSGVANSENQLEIVRTDPQAAAQFYTQASSRGHILAAHRLGHLHSAGIGIPRSCHFAVQSFKSVAERGDWSAELSDAYNLYEKGDSLRALMKYSLHATMGVESAQANAAFILAKGMCPIPLESISNSDSSRGAFLNSTQWNSTKFVSSTVEEIEKAYTASCEARALSLYRQSAVLGNADGYLKVGDMHYYGMGGLPSNKKNAALYYQMAADMHHTHAMFNLGFMHEVGDGVNQDFHLAKRYYDQVAEFDRGAKLPSFLAVSFLQIHRSFQTTFGKDSTDQVGEFLLTLSVPLNIVSKIKNLPIVRRSLGKYSGEIALLHSGGNKISGFAEGTWSSMLGLKGYCERLLDRMSKSPLGTLAIIFRPEPKSSGTQSAETTASGEMETLVILVLTALFLIFFDLRRQRARRRQQEPPIQVPPEMTIGTRSEEILKITVRLERRNRITSTRQEDGIMRTTLRRGWAEISGQDSTGRCTLDELVDEQLGIWDIQREVIRRLQSSRESEIRLFLRQNLLGYKNIIEL